MTNKITLPDGTELILHYAEDAPDLRELMGRILSAHMQTGSPPSGEAK